MPQKSHIASTQQRDQRQQAYLKADVLGERYPQIREIGVDMRFRDPDGKLTPSPQRRVFLPEMRAYFDLLCPLKDCQDGGFEVDAAIHRKVAGARSDTGGGAICQGRRPRTGDKGRACGLELEYVLAIKSRLRVAA